MLWNRAKGTMYTRTNTIYSVILNIKKDMERNLKDCGNMENYERWELTRNIQKIKYLHWREEY